MSGGREREKEWIEGVFSYFDCESFSNLGLGLGLLR